MAFGYLCRASNFISELQSFLFFHINLSCLVLCIWTDLWTMMAVKTDQVMDEKLEASGFIPEWFMR